LRRTVADRVVAQLDARGGVAQRASAPQQSVQVSVA